MVRLCPEPIVRFVQNAPKSTLALRVFCGILRLSQDSFGGRSYSLLTGSALVSFSTVRAEPILFPLTRNSLLQHRVQRALPVTFQIDRDVVET